MHYGDDDPYIKSRKQGYKTYFGEKPKDHYIVHDLTKKSVIL